MRDISEIFSYEGNEIAFETKNGITYVNATEMAKRFDKRPNDYLSLKSTNELINAITRRTGKFDYQLVIRKTGMPKFGGGVWLHEDIAIDFAQWLSVDFKLWCQERIKELLLKGYTEIVPVASTNVPCQTNCLPKDYIEALEALLKSEKEKVALREAKRISDSIIKEQEPKVNFTNTAKIAQKGDMLIREVRKKLESHGYDIAEKNLRLLLEEQKFFTKTGRCWMLAHYRYRTDEEYYGQNTVYVTELGFQKMLSTFSDPYWRKRFISLGGRITSETA